MGLITSTKMSLTLSLVLIFSGTIFSFDTVPDIVYKEKAGTYGVEPYEKGDTYKVGSYEKATPYRAEPYEKAGTCYAILSKLSGRALTIDNESHKAVQYSYLNGKSQIFRVEHEYDGVYRLKSTCGRYLTSSNDGVILLSDQTYSSKQTNQLWVIERAEKHNPHVTIKPKNKDCCVEVAHEALDNYAAVITNTCYKRLNQLWYIVPVPCDAENLKVHAKLQIKY